MNNQDTLKSEAIVRAVSAVPLVKAEELALKLTPLVAPMREGVADRDGALEIQAQKLFRAVGTAVWKLEGRMVDAETREAKEEYRREWRHVEAIKDALAEAGVDVVDWTGKRYDEGLPLKVVAEEEREGTTEAEIVETLLPTIRFRNTVQLQQGEVVVSRPPRGRNGGREGDHREDENEH